MTRRRRITVATVALGLVLATAGAACGSSGASGSGGGTSTTASSSGTSAAPPISGLAAPVVLTPSQTSATVDVGTTVVFDMGEPGEGSFVAVSDDSSVFAVESEGKVEGTMTTNAGGKAMGAGTAVVAVSFHGSTNGVGTPTRFTITVR